MKLVVGLGNPGRKYARTRHNIGFMVVDTMASALAATSWRDERHALVARASVDGEVLLLARPQTFMNNSGIAVRELAGYYRVEPSEILVVSDDLDLPFGRLRLRPHGTAGGHNGLRSIIAQLGTQEFPRLKVGIGRPDRGEPLDWVLSPFAPDEERDLPIVLDAAAAVVKHALRDGLLAAMNECNGRADVRLPAAGAARQPVVALPKSESSGHGVAGGDPHV
ncbi:MAG TPA: aminoacyl-tRNA hydrolase [Chloroflexota bacterium]|nr:aminoacyl-tRNA hydrolase [Chloroflexota bacterium]